MKPLSSPRLWAVSVVLFAIAASLCGTPITAHLRKPDQWFRTEEAKVLAANVLSWQAPAGDWPKNSDTTLPYEGDRTRLRGTFDNGATTDELRFLARMVSATGDRSCKTPFLRGLEHLLKAQYANGGWPQFFPAPQDQYHRHITFNDGTMVRLMDFVREVATDERYAFVPHDLRRACQRAFDRGVDCILKCQIHVNGKLTGWCAQHDEVDFSPRPARSYELPSLSGSESVGIVRLLMSLEKPSPGVIRSIEAAVGWFESAKLSGVKVVDVKPEGALKDRAVVTDASAKPMWARFYEIETNRPIFSGRDGVKKYSLAEIERERRTGYAWLGYWPEELLAEAYPAWKARVGKAGRRPEKASQ